MRILHLSDLHYRSDKPSKADQKKLIESLSTALAGEEVDMVFFTGDLVNKGNRLEDFQEASELLMNLAASLGVDKAKVFICGGNHDVHRDQELAAIQSEFDKIDSSQKLDAFISSQGGKQFQASLANFSNYLDFQNTFYDYIPPGSNTDIVKELYSMHHRTLEGKKIGIATINTAWRSSKSETDRGNLFYPSSIIKTIADEFKQTVDFKILLLHHPISDLKSWNASEVEDHVYNGFNMMFSGHVHKRKNGTFITNDEGIFCAVAPATLSLHDKNSNVGFSIFDIDLDTFEVEIDNKLYNKEENIFYHQRQIIQSEIPLQGPKKDQNEFRRKLRDIFAEETKRADELFISSSESALSRPFLDLFTAPILKTKSRAEAANKHEIVQTISLDDAGSSKTNYVIYGKDKSGKTSLLYKILLDLLSSFSTMKMIPLYIDASKYKNTGKDIDFIGLVAQKLMISRGKSGEYLSKHQFRILVDNYNPNNEWFCQQLSNFLRTTPNSSFVLTTEETIQRSYQDFGLGEIMYTNLYIHEISRSEIRKLTNKWPSIPADKKETILEKISEIFRQLNMPMNYWTVSLFLWIFEKTNDANFHNNFELIQLYIDNLLDRKRLVLDKSIKLDYEDFKTFLGELAHELMVKHKESTYSIEYSDLIAFASRYRETNKRFVIPVKDIVTLIIEKGILKKTVDDKYTFRLNGVFEFFIAFYMKDNKDFRDRVIRDSNYYLSFSNELELYSGFSKKDKSFVEEIFYRTIDIFKPINEKYNGGRSKDEILVEKISEVFDISIPLRQLTSGKSASLPPELQDKLLEDLMPMEKYKAEVSEKRFYDQIDITSENLEKALFILSRVFRNSSINDDAFNNSIIDFVLDSGCNLGFLLIDESAEANEVGVTDISNDSDENIILKLITSFMPLMVQTLLFDSLAQSNLERIFEEKIDQLKKDKTGNQFKLLILYLILIDLDVRGNKGYISELIENVDLGILRQTTLVKLYGYLSFKCHNHPDLEAFIRQKIQELTLRIDSTTNLGSLQGNFEKAKKIRLIKHRGHR